MTVTQNTARGAANCTSAAFAWPIIAAHAHWERTPSLDSELSTASVPLLLLVAAGGRSPQIGTKHIDMAGRGFRSLLSMETLAFAAMESYDRTNDEVEDGDGDENPSPFGDNGSQAC